MIPKPGKQELRRAVFNRKNAVFKTNKAVPKFQSLEQNPPKTSAFGRASLDL
jgi:hypothetical protein